jgi:hypothetical protein
MLELEVKAKKENKKLSGRALIPVSMVSVD